MTYQRSTCGDVIGLHWQGFYSGFNVGRKSSIVYVVRALKFIYIPLA